MNNKKPCTVTKCNEYMLRFEFKDKGKTVAYWICPGCGHREPA